MPNTITPPESGTQIYLRLLEYTKGYRKYFVFAVIGMIVYAFAEMKMASFIQILIDEGFIEKDPKTIQSIPFILMVIVICRSGGTLIANYFMAWVGRGVIQKLRAEMFSKLLEMPMRYYDTASSGEMVATFSFNVEQVAEAITNVITTLIRDICLVIFLVGYMFSMSLQLSIVLFITTPILMIVVYLVSFRFRKVSRRIQQSVGKVTHIVSEAVEGQQIVKLYGGQKSEKQNFAIANIRNFQQNLKLSLTSAFSNAIIQLIAGAALIGIVYLSTSGFVGDITPGIFSAFIVAMARMAPPMKHLMSVNAQLQKGIAAAQSMFELLDAQSEYDQGQKQLASVKGQIEFRNVSFAYENSKSDVLENINFIAEPGQTIALVGSSGSGKSTIAKLLPRFYDVMKGNILLDGENIQDYQLGQLRNQIAFVSQHVTLFNDTVANNIAYGQLTNASRSEIEQAAQAAHALEFIKQLPNGLDTVVGEDGVLLSGGQRQRLAIARAFLKNSPILVLDEATSALDSESEQHIQTALADLLKNRTTIVIAHRLSTIEKADKIIVLEAGKIVEVGKHEELLAKGERYASFYEIQFNRDPIVSEEEDSDSLEKAKVVQHPSYTHNFLVDESDATIWERMWYGHHPMAQLLAPIGYLFGILVKLRRVLYERGAFSRTEFNMPIIIIGNITVGGTGKTPLVIWLANYLREKGYAPGVISRGYKGKSTQWPLVVTKNSDPSIVGDEAAMIAQRTQCPMVIGPDRPADVRHLLEQYECNIIIADDGLQHYALARDIEIVVADGARGFGNGMLLPAGPMREPKSRLAEIDYIVTNGASLPNAYSMYLKGSKIVNLSDVNQILELSSLQGRYVHAVAAIGNPERFFEMLRSFGLNLIEHRFTDHHQYHLQDLLFEDDLPVIMTEKDAVKYRRLIDQSSTNNFWYFPVQAELPEEFKTNILENIEALIHEKEAA